jgi:hypothetical protein
MRNEAHHPAPALAEAAAEEELMAFRIGCWTLAIACLLVVAVAAEAAPPQDTTYQGRLLDSVGDPLVGPVNIEIGVWDQPTGGAQLYGETHSGVALEDGVFNLLLGTGSALVGSFDADLFASQNRYLEVIVNAEVLVPRQPFSSVAYALRSEESEEATYATTSGDADTVDGSHAADLDQSPHLLNVSNPHLVTAAQTGAATPEEVTTQVSTHAAIASAHHSKTTSFPELSGQAADGQIPSSIARDSELVWGNLSGIPAGFADGVDHGLLSEADPQVGANTTHRVPRWNGSALVTGAIVDEGSGEVGIGIDAPNHKLHLLDAAAGLSYPLKLDNPSAGTPAVGVLFSTEGDGGSVSPLRGKGAIAYEKRGTWNRGSLHVLQDSGANANNPDLGDAVMTVTNIGDVGIGTTFPQALLDVQDLARIRGNTWPAGGTGGSLELAYNGGANRGYLQAYDRTGEEFGELYLGAEEITRPVKEGILRIPPAAFQEVDEYGNWRLKDGGDWSYCDDALAAHCRAVASVDLPDGATVTRLVTYWRDNDSADSGYNEVWLRWHNPYDAAAFGLMAEAEMTGASSNRRTASDDSIDDATISLWDRAYRLEVQIENLGLDVIFYGAKIEYTYTTLGP